MLRLGNRAHRHRAPRGRPAAGRHRTPPDAERIQLHPDARAVRDRAAAHRTASTGRASRSSAASRFVSLAEHPGRRRRHTCGARRANEEASEASYVIAADGSHSPVRKALGLPFDGTVAAAELRARRPAPRRCGAAKTSCRSSWPATVFSRCSRWATGDSDSWRPIPTASPATPTSRALDDIQRLYDRTAHIPARLYDLNWSSRFRINSRHMDDVAAGPGVLRRRRRPRAQPGRRSGHERRHPGHDQPVVEARHGAATAAAKPELLDTYESDRLPVIRQLVAMTERATKVFNSTNPIMPRRADAAGAPRAVPRGRPGQGGPATRPDRRVVPGLPDRQGRRQDRIACAQATGCPTWR